MENVICRQISEQQVHLVKGVWKEVKVAHRQEDRETGMKEAATGAATAAEKEEAQKGKKLK